MGTNLKSTSPYKVGFLNAVRHVAKAGSRGPRLSAGVLSAWRDLTVAWALGPDNAAPAPSIADATNLVRLRALLDEPRLIQSEGKESPNG